MIRFTEALMNGSRTAPQMARAPTASQPHERPPERPTVLLGRMIKSLEYVTVRESRKPFYSPLVTAAGGGRGEGGVANRWYLSDNKRERHGPFDWLIITSPWLASNAWRRAYTGTPPLVAAAAALGDPAFSATVEAIGNGRPLATIACLMAFEGPAARAYAALPCTKCELTDGEGILSRLVIARRSPTLTTVVLHSTHEFAEKLRAQNVSSDTRAWTALLKGFSFERHSRFGDTAAARQELAADAGVNTNTDSEERLAATMVGAMARLLYSHDATLATWLPGWGPRIHKWEDAYPGTRCVPPHAAAVPSARASFAGDFISGPRAGSIEGAFLSGLDAAAAVRSSALGIPIEGGTVAVEEGALPVEGGAAVRAIRGDQGRPSNSERGRLDGRRLGVVYDGAAVHLAAQQGIAQRGALQQPQVCQVVSMRDAVGRERRHECKLSSERRRSLGDVGAPERGAADCPGGRCESIGAWHALWTRRIECWWMALPIFEQEKIGGCLGALGLHLGGRFDAFIRTVAGGGSTPKAPAASAEPGCEWISGGGLLGQLELPSFPQLDDTFDLKLPPLPRLVPSWERLHSLRPETPLEMREAPAPALALLVALGAASGVAASVLFIGCFGGCNARRRPSAKARPAIR